MIRSAKDQSSAREALTDPKNKQLSLSIDQADAVLKLQLGQLTRLNKGKLTDEKSNLETSRTELKGLVDDDETIYMQP